MSNSEIREKVIAILSNLSGIDSNELNDKTLIGPSGIDSIVFIEAMAKVEQKLDIEIDDEELDVMSYKNIGDLVRFFEKKYKECNK